MFSFKACVKGLIAIALLAGAVACPQTAQGRSDVRAEVVALIERYYPGDVDPRIYLHSSAAAIVQGLNDPYSVYMTEQEYERFMQEMDGAFCGIGIYMETVPEGILITDTMPGSPAEAAGLKAGDIIYAIDNVPVQGMAADEVQSRMQGREGSKAAIMVKREARQLKFTVERAALAAPSVRGKQLGDRVAYLAVRSFSSNSAFEMEHYITLLDPECDQWIIDLRSNAGGYISTSAELAGFLMKVSNMVVVQQKEGRLQLPVAPQSIMIDEPVIVLLDGYSASASELLAAALKDYQRALLVGETSFGKGTMQQLFPLSNGDALKLTVAEFYSPRGYKINHCGVAPDIRAPAQEALAAAWLLLSQPSEGESRAYIEAGGSKFMVDLQAARSDDCWEAWNILTKDAGALEVEYASGLPEGKIQLSRDDIVRRWPVYYPNYRFLGDFNNLAGDQPVLLSIQGLQPDGEEGGMGLELIDSQSGRRVSCATEQAGTLVRLLPGDISIGHEYWLLLHGQSADGADAPPAAIAILRY